MATETDIKTPIKPPTVNPQQIQLLYYSDYLKTTFGDFVHSVIEPGLEHPETSHVSSPLSY